LEGCTISRENPSDHPLKSGHASVRAFRNVQHLLYKGPLDHGVIDMDAGNHRRKKEELGMPGL
jgi:hypothetical protein